MEWTEQLPERVKVSLDALIDRVQRHENSYMDADNASVGQIWVSMALMNERLEKLEEIVMAQRKALNEMNADVSVDRHLDKNLEESLKRY
jgi:uncharacterized coiled-coil protein SlyX